tara:strand:+ start:656 stop:919 length:264 start_codon:yes stop_codon:yes gene_type:complete
MGGARIFKSIVRSITKAAPQPAAAATPVAAPAMAAAQTESTNMTKKATLSGGGYGGDTILSSAKGDESEANISKTILGGGKKKNIKS